MGKNFVRPYPLTTRLFLVDFALVDLIGLRFWRVNMSMHRSFKSASKIVKRRNVLKRYERVDVLRKRDQWKEGDRAFGLPKTKPTD